MKAFLREPDFKKLKTGINVETSFDLYKSGRTLVSETISYSEVAEVRFYLAYPNTGIEEYFCDVCVTDIDEENEIVRFSRYRKVNFKWNW